MGRPRKPTVLLETAGAFRHDPSRAAAREFEPCSLEPLGDPPACFEPLQRGIWRELAAMAPANVLSQADRWLVEILCRLMARVRAGEYLHAAEYSLIMNGLGRMGLTPSDRSRVIVPAAPPEETDPFAQLAADASAAKPI